MSVCVCCDCFFSLLCLCFDFCCLFSRNEIHKQQNKKYHNIKSEISLKIINSRNSGLLFCFSYPWICYNVIFFYYINHSYNLHVFFHFSFSSIHHVMNTITMSKINMIKDHKDIKRLEMVIIHQAIIMSIYHRERQKQQ